MTRPTENQLAEAVLRWAEALIEHYFNEHHMAFREALDKLDVAVKAYRSAQQAEAGAHSSGAGDWAWARFAEWFMGKYLRSPDTGRYPQDLGLWQAFERGRQQGVEQASPCETAAVKTLIGMRFTWDGGEQWKPAASSAQDIPEVCGKIIDWEAEHKRLRHENNQLRKANEKLRAAQ